MENNMEYLPTHPYRQEEFDENAASLRLTSNSQPCEKPQPHFRRLQGPGGVVSGNKCGEHSTFHPFERLPAEIQRTIWSLSLPGPRLLSVGRMATTAIYFPKEHHTPNPAALSVCRTSRDEALKRYRIAFGTEHVYADFARDILYFGPWNRESDFSLLWLLGFTKSGRLDYRQTSLKVTDLDCVTRIALTFNLLDRPGRFRKDNSHADEPMTYARYIAKEMMEEFHEFPSRKEKMFGMPQVQLVQANRLRDEDHQDNASPSHGNAIDREKYWCELGSDGFNQI
ncbi:hypothetical protein DL98DRAFT_581558 [Cadophora sp. DSE1049]|nr:hypothetical protein DL98DRAFT_581558 [Cadophora sp. DSE1049]